MFLSIDTCTLNCDSFLVILVILWWCRELRAVQLDLWMTGSPFCWASTLQLVRWVCRWRDVLGSAGSISQETLGAVWGGTLSTIRRFLYSFQATRLAAESSWRLVDQPKARHWQLAQSFSAQPTHTAGSASALAGVAPWLVQLLIGIYH